MRRTPEKNPRNNVRVKRARRAESKESQKTGRKTRSETSFPPASRNLRDRLEDGGRRAPVESEFAQQFIPTIGIALPTVRRRQTIPTKIRRRLVVFVVVVVVGFIDVDVHDDGLIGGAASASNGFDLQLLLLRFGGGSPSPNRPDSRRTKKKSPRGRGIGLFLFVNLLRRRTSLHSNVDQRGIGNHRQ